MTQAILSKVYTDMRRSTALLVFVATILVAASIRCTHQDADYKVVQGVLDLRDATIDDSFRVSLDGDWEFYWNQLLTPADFQSDNDHHKEYAFVPANWLTGTQDSAHIKDITGQGYATYRLTILLPESYPHLSLKMLDTSSSYRLWINGELYGENGIVSANLQTAKPSYKTALYDIALTGRTIELVIEVANFAHQRGGIWEPIKLGSYKAVHTLREYMLAFEALVAGSLLIMGFYHIGLFLLRKKDKSTLWFGFFCLVITLRVLVTGERFLHSITPIDYWELLVKIEYLIMTIGLIFFMLFLQNLYPDEMPKLVLRIVIGIEILLTLPVLILAVKTYSAYVMIYEAMLMVGALICSYTLTKAIIHKRQGAAIVTFSTLVFVFSVINDILYASGIIVSFQMVGFGLFIFIFSQSFILSMKFSKAFSMNETLSENLTQYNRAYSRFVPQEFLQYLSKDSILDIELGDQTHAEMTIVFIDIRGFTTMSESMTPKENFDFLNTYLSRVSPLIRKHSGFIDKYLGDGFMALFPRRPDDALLAIIEIETAIDELNRELRRQNRPTIQTGAGIHTGRLMLGIVGEAERLDGTVISDAVNLASRMETLNKVYGSSVVVSEDTLFRLEDPTKFNYRFLGRVQVKGKTSEVSIFEFFDSLPKDERIVKIVTRTDFERAVTAWHAKEYDEALQLFKAVLRADPNDSAAKQYIQLMLQPSEPA